MRWWPIWVVLGSFAGSADALELWLASSQNCNSCEIYQRAAQARGYGFALQYPAAAGAGTTRIPILSIDKSVLAADILSQLPADEGPRNPAWDVTLTVLVMDADRVLLAGNIADSADNNGLRHSNGVMFPPASPAQDDPVLHADNIYAEFFAAHWNLEYFIDVALGKKPARIATRLVDLKSAVPETLGANNVILWGSAPTPFSNALFIPTRIAEIRAALDGMSIGPLRYATLYGHGPGVDGNDTSYIEDGRLLFKRADVRADYAADAAGLNAVLTGVLQADRAHTLLVQVGHSGPTGSPLWGHGLTLLPADIAPIKTESSSQMIMVSGACHSGMFAKAVQCGFFAAHPDVLASGCQLSAEALQTSDDYLRHFFRAAAGTAAEGRGSKSRAPATLYDAHWYAATHLEDHQLSYTTTDALIDDYFTARPGALPESLTVAQIRRAAPAMTRSEADAIGVLTKGLAPDLAIPLTGYVAANHAADAKLAAATEVSSAERNRSLALPYKLMLPMLARRIAYAARRVDDANFAVAASCEQQSLQQFLGADRPR